jgi:integrase
MSQKPFYLSSRNGVWYARITDPNTGKVLPAKSTGESSKESAYLVAAQWVYSGNVPTGQKKKKKSIHALGTARQLIDQIKTVELSQSDAYKILDILKDRGLLDRAKSGEGKDFITFLSQMYDYDNSPYIQEKLAHGQSIGRTHCHDSQCRINNYWAKPFKGRTLGSITRDDLRSFSLGLIKKKLSTNTVNKVMIVGKVALSWAYREGYIPTNPSEKLANFVVKPKKRGILTDEETNKLFSIPWKNERAYVGNLVAATCGLRAGEVLGLRVEDIGLDRLFIKQAWIVKDKFKTPKNGEERQVPLLPYVREALLKLADQNPWGDGLIFFSDAGNNQPMVHNVLSEAMKEAFYTIGITEEERVERNIVFHSWRHRYATKMADLVDARSLGQATGHKTPAMLEHYAAHANENRFNAVKVATEKAFG